MKVEKKEPLHRCNTTNCVNLSIAKISLDIFFKGLNDTTFTVNFCENCVEKLIDGLKQLKKELEE